MPVRGGDFGGREPPEQPPHGNYPKPPKKGQHKPTPGGIYYIGVWDDGAYDYPDQYKSSITAEYHTDQFNRDFSSGPWPTQQVNLLRYWCGIDDPAKAARDVQKVSDRKGGPHGTSVIQIRC